ncbi:MAG: DUF1566 domain-containing protein [Magnetococcus sp. XQGC-1]
MSAPGAPIIELRGHVVADVMRKLDPFARATLQEWSAREGAFASFMERLLSLWFLLLRMILRLFHSATMVRPLFGIQEAVTLQFYKDHIDLTIESFLFGTVHGQQQQRIPWQNTSIYGKRTAVLYLFKRCHLFINHKGDPLRITDLGPMPDAAFQKLLSRLQSLANSPAIRQQVVSKPYRFAAEGLQLLAMAMAGVFLAAGVGVVALAYGPQLLQWIMEQSHPEENKTGEEETKPTLEEEKPPPPLEAGYAFLGELEEKYRNILKTDPNNEAAKRGLAMLAEQYLSLARNAADDRSWNKATTFLDRAERINPNLEGIEPLRKKIQQALEEAMANSRGEHPSTRMSTVEQRRKEFLGDEGSRARLRNNGDGTVTDTTSGLVGLAGSCFDQLPWEAALAAVGGLGHGQCGLRDNSQVGEWRLPSKEELTRLLVWEKSGLFSVVQGRSYWSGSSRANDQSTAWFANPKSGYIDFDHKSNGAHHVWPVRESR